MFTPDKELQPVLGVPAWFMGFLFDTFHFALYNMCGGCLGARGSSGQHYAEFYEE